MSVNQTSVNLLPIQTTSSDKQKSALFDNTGSTQNKGMLDDGKLKSSENNAVEKQGRRAIVDSNEKVRFNSNATKVNNSDSSSNRMRYQNEVNGKNKNSGEHADNNNKFSQTLKKEEFLSAVKNGTTSKHSIEAFESKQLNAEGGYFSPENKPIPRNLAAGPVIEYALVENSQTQINPNDSSTTSAQQSELLALPIELQNEKNILPQYNVDNNGYKNSLTGITDKLINTIQSEQSRVSNTVADTLSIDKHSLFSSSIESFNRVELKNTGVGLTDLNSNVLSQRERLNQTSVQNGNLVGGSLNSAFISGQPQVVPLSQEPQSTQQISGQGLPLEMPRNGNNDTHASSSILTLDNAPAQVGHTEENQNDLLANKIVSDSPSSQKTISTNNLTEANSLQDIAENDNTRLLGAQNGEGRNNIDSVKVDASAERSSSENTDIKSSKIPTLDNTDLITTKALNSESIVTDSEVKALSRTNADFFEGKRETEIDAGLSKLSSLISKPSDLLADAGIKNSSSSESNRSGNENRFVGESKTISGNVEELVDAELIDSDLDNIEIKGAVGKQTINNPVGTGQVISGQALSGQASQTQESAQSSLSTNDVISQQQLAKLQETYSTQKNAQTMLNQLTNPQWSNAVADKVLWLAAQNIQTADVQLDPPELGQLHIRININQDNASVNFVSAHASVREVLEANSFRLRDMFQQEGLDLVDVGVSDQSAKDKSFQGRDGEGGFGDSQENGAQGISDTGQDATKSQVEKIELINLIDYYA